MLKIDNTVFALKDQRVQALLKGKMTTQFFLYTLKSDDYLVFLDGTIYALSQIQYYAMAPIIPAKQLTKQQFQSILAMDLSDLSQLDKKAVQSIKQAKDSCSSCRYKAFKNKLGILLSKYPKYKVLLGQSIDAHILERAQYPQTKYQIPSKISKMHPHLFQPITYDRAPCFDCVQKHVGMAYVKGTQVATGYPEHFMLCLANLQEAYQECPHECQELKQTLMFCIAKSKLDKKPFVPVKILAGLIDIFRRNSTSQVALLQNKPTEDVSLQLSQENKEQLYGIPVTTKIEIAKVLQGLFKITAQQNIDQNRQQKDIWAGKMVQLADQLLPFSDQVANIVRNRRLLFKAAPSLSIGTPYSCQDIYEALKKS